MTNQAIRDDGMTVWQRIRELLASDILSGKLAGKLPNEATLAERFAVNRHTVRQAVKALADQGIVEVTQGRGTFVRNDLIDYQLGRRTRFAHSVMKARRAGNSQLLHWEVVQPSPEVAAMLQVPASSQVLQIDSLDIVDGATVGVCTQYFPLPRFAGFGEIYEQTGKTHLALAHYGVTQFQRNFSRISARIPNAEIARQLSQPVAFPVLYIEAVYVDENERIIEYGISNMSSTAVQLVIESD